jgi:purine-nucleoside phosphorylase
MTEPYSSRLRDAAIAAALSLGIQLHRGVYVGLVGPSLETAAETRFLRAIGCDAVGMSVIMEAITAVHAGLDVLGISVVTNVNLPDNYQPAPLEDIIATAEKAGPRLVRLLEAVVKTMP